MDRYDYYGLTEDDKNALDSEDLFEYMNSEMLGNDYIYDAIDDKFYDDEYDFMSDGADFYTDVDYDSRYNEIDSEYYYEDHIDEIYNGIRDEYIDAVFAHDVLYDLITGYAKLYKGKPEEYFSDDFEEACMAYFYSEVLPVYMMRYGSVFEKELKAAICKHLEDIYSDVCALAEERYMEHYNEPPYDTYEEAMGLR